MQRREYITLGGGVLTTILAGCSESAPLESTPEPYDEDEKDDLLFDEAQSDWEDDFHRDDSINDNFDRVFTNDDETVVVLMSATIDENVEASKNGMEKSRATASNDEDYPLADDAFIADDGELATLIFRHRNARGGVAVTRQSGVEAVADRNRASTYAESLFDLWQE